MSRRQFLTTLGVLIGAGAAGGFAWLRKAEDPSGAPLLEESASSPPGTSSTSGPTAAAQAPTTTTTAAPTTTTTSSTTTTTAAPTTTTPPATTTTTTATTTTPSTTTVTTQPPLPAGGKLEAICKEAWGAAPLRGELVEHQIRWLTVHHTAVEMGSNKQAPRRIRSYQDYHQGQGWPDVAYHYFIDANGHVYEGRPYSAQGDTLTEYDPAGHFLVCCDGHFDRQPVPAAQLAALADVLAWASARFGVAPSTIAGHRAYAATTCPGGRLNALITDGTVRAMVEQRIAAGGVSLISLCGPAGVDRVADIEAGVV